MIGIHHASHDLGELGRRELSSSPVSEIAGDNDISYRVPSLWGYSIKRRLERVSGGAEKEEGNARPIASRFLLTEQLLCIFWGYVAWQAFLLATLLRAPYQTVDYTLWLFLPSGDGSSSKFLCSFRRLVFSLRRPGLVPVLREPNKGIQAHAYKTIPMISVTHAEPGPIVIMASPAKPSQVMDLWVKLHDEAGFRKFSFCEIPVDDPRSFHNTSLLVRCRPIVTQYAKNAYDKRMAAAYDRHSAALESTV